MASFSSDRRQELGYFLVQYRLHLLTLQVVCDGGEEVSGVGALQVRAALRVGGHDALIQAQGL